MTDSNSKKPLAYLDTHGTVSVLWHKLKKMEKLNALVDKYLDENCKNYCKATSFLNGKLTLVAANSSIASQLHFQSADLLRKLKQEEALASLQTIHCKVQVQTMRAPRAMSKEKKLKPISAKSARVIAEIAEGISDEKLKAAMKKLAENHASTKIGRT